ncbi:hypothetical protein [Geodermatophilus ruber]|uniref:Uncharacterized protein n=1 Tax=Geodermatophilus ruber TaxID=504800 RepID=A0A1I3YRY7_9ACTN|nr:hypothetical protein [Geodermatophilus ruber]SFK34119.1 hypothetical protein SAMN04488085_101156 [Geodermatophilus ruber]
MGRHSAAEDAAVDPVIAAALEQRPAGLPARRHGQLQSEDTQSGLGWPGTSTTHEGLGWPGDMSPARDSAVPAPPEPPARPRGWRRFFRAA